METLIQDVRHAWRGLRRSPGFTLAALVTLALGIGANTAVFSMVNAVLLHPLPFRDPERLVMVWNRWEAFKLHHSAISGPDYAERRDRCRTLEGLGAFQRADAHLTGSGEPERLAVGRMTASVFEVLGTPARRGRVFTRDEDAVGSDRVVVLSDALWRRRFGADPSIVGRTLRLDGVTRTVIGIMPRAFAFPAPEVQLWIPLALTAAQTGPENRGNEWLLAVGRMRPGVPLERVASELNLLCTRTLGESPSFFREKGWGAEVTRLEEDASSPYRSPLLLLLAAVGFVLLVACGNVAHLMLSRAASREREIAIRASMGASRARLARQLLTESLLLALLGGAAGLVAGVWLADLLAGLGVAGLPRLDSFGLDARVIGFTFALATLTGLLFGLAPALHVRDGALGEILRATAAGAGGGRSSRTRATLIAAETALTVLLLVGAGLSFRSLLRLQQVDPGFDPRGVLVARTGIPALTYPDSARQVGFYQRLVETLAVTPGVNAVGAVSALPLTGANATIGFRVEGRAASHDPSDLLAQTRVVAGDYFRAIGIPLVRGPGFSPPGRAGAAYEAIVDERFARAVFPGESPVGRRIVFGGGTTLTLVGVAGNVKEAGLDADSRMMLYLPVTLFPLPSMSVVARTAGDPLALAPAIRRAVWSIDRDLPVYDVSSLESVVSGSVAGPRIRAWLLAVFAALALLLAAIGVSGVVAWSVARRTREIGLRMALGASPGDVLRLVVREGITPVVVGGALGLALALVLGRLIQGQLYGVRPTDPATYVAITAILLVVALVAAAIPARRATRVEPMEALRCE